MTMREIDRLIDIACHLYRHAVQADPPDGPDAMDAYVKARADVRTAIGQYKHTRLTDYLEGGHDVV